MRFSITAAPGKNFSFGIVDTPVDIPNNQQMLIFQEQIVIEEITIDGELVVLF